MKIKNFIVATMATWFFAVSSLAFAEQKINLVLPMSPGGGTAALSKFVERHLEADGYDVNLQLVGNVANAKRIFERTNVPTVVAWENGYLLEEDHIGNIGAPTSDDFFNIWFWAPYYICASPDVEDVLSVSGNVGVNPHPSLPHWVVDSYVEKNPDINPVTYTNSGEIKSALVSGEVDVVISDRALAWENEGIAKCHYNTGTTTVSGLPSFANALDNDSASFSLIVYSFTVNMDDETRRDAQKAFKSALRSDDVVDFFEGRGADQTAMQLPEEEQLRFIESTLGN